MGKTNIITGLEMGCTRFRMVAGEIVKNGEFLLLGISEIESSNGLKNGTIIDLDVATEAIARLSEDINQKTNKKINSTFVNISGLNIRREIVNSVITLPQRGCEITAKNLYDLLESCKIISIPLDRDLLYLLPLEYIIDGQDGIKEPIGLCGNRLEAKVLVITAPFNQVQNIIRAVNSAGLEIEEIVLSPLACGNSLLNLEEKKEGVLLIDFKTDLTEVSIFKEGSLMFFETISKGQRDITNEIVATFKIPAEIAEELKIGYGFLDNAGQDSRNQEAIPLEWMGVKQHILRGEINKVISQQAGLLFDLILEKLKDLKAFNNIIKRGAVLSGGCTLMEGFLEGAVQRLGFTVRIGVLKQDIGPLGNNYIISSGLVKFGLEKRLKTKLKNDLGFFKKVYQKADELLTEYF